MPSNADKPVFLNHNYNNLSFPNLMRKISGSSPKMTRKLSFPHLMLRCLRSKLGQESAIDYPVKPDNDKETQLSFPCSGHGNL